ncbi:hypothetical protein [Streptomyces noursei]|uniref:hypothetical protein n=1 Tax=Streptomyces noursei TaxID=1971 RepID=UPI001675029B|nr:hypothetical protein [Streptomyces noursei]MCZ1013027.1 hypothetical protein [Streptomyces noursei]GGX43163.1 hypothetical protein GCM10010341_76450 [Streptomyces noursei]
MTLKEALQRMSIAGLGSGHEGSTVWDVRTDIRRYAVKLGYPTAKHKWTALAPAREAAVLDQLGVDDVHHGEWAEGTWNAQPWHPGSGFFDRWQPRRHPDEPAEPSLADAFASTAALSLRLSATSRATVATKSSRS